MGRSMLRPYILKRAVARVYYFPAGEDAGATPANYNCRTSPLSLFFQRGFNGSGQLNSIAPGVGQSSTQQPQYQHSSACKIIGGVPLRGFGIKTSREHVSTQELHPLHTSGLNITGMLGVVILGIANTVCSDTISPPLSNIIYSAYIRRRSPGCAPRTASPYLPRSAAAVHRPVSCYFPA